MPQTSTDFSALKYMCPRNKRNIIHCLEPAPANKFIAVPGRGMQMASRAVCRYLVAGRCAFPVRKE